MATRGDRSTAPSHPEGDGPSSGALDPLLRFVAVVLAAACIYWAQAVLVPIALAVLITFLLSPPVTALQRRGAPRVVAVLAVMLLALAVVAGVGTVLTVQVMSLGEELPRYRDNIREKIADVRSVSQDSGLRRAKETVERAATEAERQVERDAPRPDP